MKWREAPRTAAEHNTLEPFDDISEKSRYEVAMRKALQWSDFEIEKEFITTS